VRIMSSGRKVFRRPLQQQRQLTFPWIHPLHKSYFSGLDLHESNQSLTSTAEVSTPPRKYIAFQQTQQNSKDSVGFLTANPISLLSSPWVDAQHKIIKKVVGQYPPIVHTVMADDNPDEQKAILDLGCGSGAWLDIFLFNVDVTTSWADLSSKDYRGCKRFPMLHRGRCRSSSYAICVGPLSSIRQITCSFSPAGICLPIAG
jgi:hypothetical protein